MTAASEAVPASGARAWVAPLLGALLLAGCGLESTNTPPYEPGVQFHGKVQMGMARDADGTLRPVARITD